MIFFINNNNGESSLKYFLLLSLLYCSSVYSSLPTAKVIKIRGNVYYNNKRIKLGDQLDSMGKLETKKSSYVKLEIKKWGNQIAIGANSIMKLNFSKQTKQNYHFIQGLCRWISIKTKSKVKTKGRISTPTASVGVRGTDFLLIATDILKETEIIVFHGKVIFTNPKNKKDSKFLTKGQWGGLGGRFGSKIGKILNLPKPVLTHFNKTIF